MAVRFIGRGNRSTDYILNLEGGNNRTYPLCDTNGIGDEFHHILQCRYFEQSRKHLIPSYFRKRPNVLKFKHIMTVTKKSDLFKLCKMIKVINEGICVTG